MIIIDWLMYRFLNGFTIEGIGSEIFFLLFEYPGIGRAHNISGLIDKDRNNLCQSLCIELRIRVLIIRQCLLVSRFVNEQKKKDRCESIAQQISQGKSLNILLKSRNILMELSDLCNKMLLNEDFKQTSFLNDSLKPFAWQGLWIDNIFFKISYIVLIRCTFFCHLSHRVNRVAEIVCREFQDKRGNDTRFTTVGGLLQLRLDDLKYRHIRQIDHKPSVVVHDDMSWESEDNRICLLYRLNL